MGVEVQVYKYSYDDQPNKFMPLNSFYQNINMKEIGNLNRIQAIPLKIEFKQFLILWLFLEYINKGIYLLFGL